MSVLDLASVIEANQQAVRLNPDDFFAHFNLARAYECQGRMEDALISYQKAVALNRQDPFVQHALGELFLRFGQPQQARLVFQRLIVTHTTFIPAHLALARLLLQANLGQEAIVRLKKCLQLDPELAEAHFLLFQVYRCNDFLGEALKSLESAIRIRPDYFLYHRHMAEFCVEINDQKAALQSIRKALAAHPEDKVSLEIACELCFAQGEHSEGSRYLKLLLEIEPLSIRGLKVKARYQILERDFSGAQRTLRGIERITPGGKDLQFLWAEVAFQGRQYARAVALLKSLEPRDYTYRLMLVESLIQVDQPREALGLIDTILAEKVFKEQVFSLRAEAQIRLFQFQEALSSLKLARELNPNSATLLHKMAMVLDQLGSFSEAQALLAQVEDLQNDSESSEANQQGAAEFLQADDKDIEQKEWERRLAREGDSLELMTAYGDWLFAKARVDDALKIWQMANALFPDCLPLQLRILECFRIQGDYVQCRSLLDSMRDQWAQSLEVLMADAALSLETGTPEQAIHCLKQARLLDPSHLESATLLLRVARLLGDMAQMQVLSDELLQQVPNHLLALKVRATKLRAQGQAEEALKDFEKVLQLTDRKDVESLHQLASILQERQQLSEAVLVYQEILLLEDQGFNHLRLGLLQSALHNSMMAQFHLEQALRMEPDLKEARRALVQLLIDQDESLRALEVLEELLHHPEQELEAVQQAAICFQRLGQNQKALRWLELFKRYRPLDPLNWFLMGQILESSTEIPQARHAYEKCLEHAKKNSRLSEYAQEGLLRLGS